MSMRGAVMPNITNNYGGMTDAQILHLKMEWGRLAPNEPNAHDVNVAWAKWEIENIYQIPNFWSPDFDEGTSFEDSLQPHRDSYTIWK